MSLHKNVIDEIANKSSQYNGGTNYLQLVEIPAESQRERVLSYFYPLSIYYFSLFLSFLCLL